MTSSPIRGMWHYLYGDVVTPGGGSVSVLPANTTATIVELRPNGDDLYFEINGGAASANSPGFVADGAGEVIGPLDNLNQLTVYMASGTVHIMFFTQHGSWR